MINLSPSKTAFINSLLLNRLPIIFVSKFSAYDINDMVVRLFGDSFYKEDKPLKLNHPDILIMGKQDTYLSIEAVRGIKEFVTKVNFELISQLVIVNFLEKIGLNQANALLKLVEESGSADYNICFSTLLPASFSFNRIPGVLETIMSRCVLVYLPETLTQVQTKDDVTAKQVSLLLDKARYKTGLHSNVYVEELTNLGIILSQEAL